MLFPERLTQVEALYDFELRPLLGWWQVETYGERFGVWYRNYLQAAHISESAALQENSYLQFIEKLQQEVDEHHDRSWIMRALRWLFNYNEIAWKIEWCSYWRLQEWSRSILFGGDTPKGKFLKRVWFDDLLYSERKVSSGLGEWFQQIVSKWGQWIASNELPRSKSMGNTFDRPIKLNVYWVKASNMVGYVRLGARCL